MSRTQSTMYDKGGQSDLAGYGGEAKSSRKIFVHNYLPN